MSNTKTIHQDEVVIRFAGDSGDGMQITGSQFTSTSAKVGNDLATFPDFPAEIRAPAGTRAGVSGFQIHFSSSEIHTPGDRPDVLVALNPAALIVNYKDLKPGGIIVANMGSFQETDFKKARLERNPLDDGTLAGYRVIKLDVNARVQEALADMNLPRKHALRCKNFYILGLMYWLYSRPMDSTLQWLEEKFAKKSELIEANQCALRAGFNLGSTMEIFQGRYEVPAYKNAPKGFYRNIMGNQALSLGLVAGAKLAGLRPLLASYPITPASEILHELSRLKRHGVLSLQMEDEIAAITAAIGASFAGSLAFTTTSGPGMALKTEALGLAVIAELPLVIVNVQRAGPSTGMPTKVEQADLNQAIFGRNGEAPIPVLAASHPGDAFDCAVEACRIAVEYMTPVILLSDNYIANGSEPWKLPKVEDLQPFPVERPHDPESYQPYAKNEKGARPWAVPGTPGLEHRIGGLEKGEPFGNVSTDPEVHEQMTIRREEKVMGVSASYPPSEVVGRKDAELLLVSWGSTFGAIRSLVDRAEENGRKIAHLHLRHLWPLPTDLESIFASYDRILIPELNRGQLSRLLQGEFPKYQFRSLSKMQGKPFTNDEIAEEVDRLMESDHE